uniref:(2Fe-2S)-binding protein n=1 Tax=Pseudomonas graminis TaxID=158627 RepID=A0A7C2B990_9PSED
MMEKILLKLCVNGETCQVAVPPNKLLLDVLREDLGLTGSKRGCDDSSCGCCAVLIDGTPMLSCVALAASYAGAEITTVEGLAPPGELHPVQEGFAVSGGAQCGYCTPGQICSAVGLANEGRASTDDEVKELMSGNLCRCGAYSNIRAAVVEVLPSMNAAPDQGGRGQ